MNATVRIASRPAKVVGFHPHIPGAIKPLAAFVQRWGQSFSQSEVMLKDMFVAFRHVPPLSDTAGPEQRRYRDEVRRIVG